LKWHQFKKDKVKEIEKKVSWTKKIKDEIKHDFKDIEKKI
jgi:hypothetical protein